ncbi:MAG: hypothetical protein JXQ67_00925 [Campylobacterales bacterium]|nr:hypothetical protein [Campylobacterales bacterium]
MKIFCTELYETQLKEILEKFSKEDFSATKVFKTYLDTIIINIPTKAQKYKKSIYFNDDNIRDIEHEAFRIPFYIDSANNSYLILAIIEK